MGKGSARTLQHWLDKGYDKDSAEKMRLSRTPGTIEYFIIYKKMSPECALDAKKKYQDIRKNTYDNFIKRYGVTDGEIKWQIYKDKQAYSNTFEYKQKRYGWDLEKYESYNKKRGSAGELNGNYGSSYYQVWVDKYGKEQADMMNESVSKEKARYGSDNGNFGREKRPVELERMSKSAIERVIRQGTCTAYNPNSISHIEKYGKENGYSFQHAENGGEYHVPQTTFFVDGYDRQNNVVIEFDEKYHLSKSQQKKDKQRQDMIGNLLKCKFIRIDEYNNIKETNY